MDTFFNVIIAGMAVAFVLSVVEEVSGELLNSRVIRLVGVLPLSFGAFSFTGIPDVFLFIVASTATAFFAATILRVVEWLTQKPTIVDRRRLLP
jgi:hypothetical protein